MTKLMKSTVCILLSLMFLLSSIGYAALTDTLSVEGSAKVEIPYGLFIIDVKSSASNVDHHSLEYLQYTTTLDSLIDRARSGSGTVTYTITVLNNTRLTYSYRNIYYQTNLSGYNGNGTYRERVGRYYYTYDYINSEGSQKLGVTTSFPNGKIVEPGETLEFTATYNVGSGMDASTDWRTLINFQFGINVDAVDQAISVVEEKFLDILNTSSTYEDLVDGLDNKFDGSQEWTSNYIGNVKDSSSEDSMIVNTLFAGQLQITVGNTEQDATVLIKHENLDGNTMTGDDYVATNTTNGGVFRGYGCEMTLYLTIDPLTASGQYVPVYAIVFTCDRDADGNIISDWYRVGDTYAGTANVVSYDGDANGTGSFVTDNWRADGGSYHVVSSYSYDINGTIYELDAYSYQVGYHSNIENIVMATDENAVRTLQTLLDHAQSIIDSQEYAGTGITLVEDEFAAASVCYTLDENGNAVARTDLTRAQLLPTISKLYYAVDEALVRMEALSKQ